MIVTKKFFKLSAFVLSIFLISNCMTVISFTHPREIHFNNSTSNCESTAPFGLVYGGLRANGRYLKDVSTEGTHPHSMTPTWLSIILTILEMPFNLVADTILSPITIYRATSENLAIRRANNQIKSLSEEKLKSTAKDGSISCSELSEKD